MNLAAFTNKTNSSLYRITVFFIYVYLLAPSIIVILVSFSPTEALVVPTNKFSIRWYIEFFRVPGFVEALKVSFKLALLASILTPLLAIPSAYAIVRYRFRFKDLLETFLLSPILIPGVIVGLSLLTFFVRIGLRGSFLSLILCHVILTFPYTVRTVMASLVGVNTSIEEAAEILGANRFQVFTKITLPLMASGVIAGVLFVFVVSFAELNASLFVAGPKTTTLPIQIFAYITDTSNPVVAAISSLQILLTFVAALIIDRVLGLGKAMRYG